MDTRKVTFYPLSEVDPAQCKYAIIAAQYQGQWIFCKNKNRQWELAGGHIEAGETPLEAAKRELYEETGATIFDITPICAYSITSYGVIFYANVKTLAPLPPSEIETIGLFDDLPQELSFPQFHPKFLQRVKDVLGEIA